MSPGQTHAQRMFHGSSGRSHVLDRPLGKLWNTCSCILGSVRMRVLSDNAEGLLGAHFTRMLHGRDPSRV